MALDLARRAGVGYADVRVGRDEQEFVFTREDRLEHLNSAYALGFGVRVLVNGSWGFAASETPGEDEVKQVVALAIENAEASSLIQATKDRARRPAGISAGLDHAGEDRSLHDPAG